MSTKKKSANPNAPLGMKIGKGPSRAEVIKVTNNLNDWAEVAGIPVPPAADNRDFSRPLGNSPVLVNGAKLPEKSNSPFEGPDETTVSQGFLPTLIKPVEENTVNKMQTIQINWYGALLALECLNVVYQPANSLKKLDGWLLLELSIQEKTKAPAWTPPVAQLDQNGKIHIPEFECTVGDKELKCQVLNIDLYDSVNKKRIFVFRVKDFTE
jgi:hypothetical protein